MLLVEKNGRAYLSINDKNDNRIYFGSLLESDDGVKGTVEFNAFSGAFFYILTEDFKEKPIKPSKGNLEEWKVIGHRKNNPELLAEIRGVDEEELESHKQDKEDNTSKKDKKTKYLFGAASLYGAADTKHQGPSEEDAKKAILLDILGALRKLTVDDIRFREISEHSQKENIKAFRSIQEEILESVNKLDEETKEEK